MDDLKGISIEEIKKSIEIYNLVYEKTEKILGTSVMQNLNTNNYYRILQFFTVDEGKTYKETTNYMGSGKDKEEETYTAKEDLIYVSYSGNLEKEEIHATRAFPIRWLFLNDEELEQAKAEETERKQTEKERELYEKLKLKFEKH